MLWWHLVLHTRGSWLHGDQRGFRSRGHRIHSRGDYRSPPPPGEHAGLHRYQQQRSAPAVAFSPELQTVVGEALKGKCGKANVELVAMSVGPTHAHVLVRGPADYRAAKDCAASLKQATSHKVRGAIPGRVWAAGGKPVAVKTRSHFMTVLRYIRDHGTGGDWLWLVDGEPDPGLRS